MKNQTLSARKFFKPLAQAMLFASTVTLAACRTGTEPVATLVFSTPPNFSATVSKIWFEGGNGPAGPYSQYDIWVSIPPSPTTNAGVVIATSEPVFLLSKSGRLTEAQASDIKLGSTIQVWHDHTLTYGAVGNIGAVQGPPGAPTYGGDQIVIVR